jgi:hypothetical protein
MCGNSLPVAVLTDLREAHDIDRKLVTQHHSSCAVVALEGVSTVRNPRLCCLTMVPVFNGGSHNYGLFLFAAVGLKTKGK